MNHKNTPKKSGENGRIAVLVLGMHRSGTSALTRALNLLGCYLPENLIGAHETNQSGHWEPRAVVLLNDRALSSQGSDWSDWAEVSPNWYRSPPYSDFVRQGQAVVQAEFGENQLFAIKDPRICRLVPFWLDVLGRENVRPVFVLPFRNPIEVAESLARRDGIDHTSALLMWLRHSLDAEYATRGHTRAITTYEQLLETPEALMARLQDKLGVIWPKSGAAMMGELRRSVTHDLRHHARSQHAVLDNPALSEWVKSTYSIMLRWAGDEPGDHDLAELDRIRAEFDACLPAFAGLASALQSERARAKQLAAEIGELRREADRAQQFGGEPAGEADSALTKEIERLRSGVIWGDKARNELEERLRQAEADLASSNAALEQARQAEVEVGHLSDRLQALGAELGTSQGRAAELENELAGLRASLQDVENDAAVTRSTLAQRSEEVDQTLRELNSAHVRIGNLEGRISQALEEIDRWRAKAGEADEWVFRLSADRAALEQKLAYSERALAERTTAAARAEAASQDNAERARQVDAELRAAQAANMDLAAQVEQLTLASGSLQERLNQAEATARDARQMLDGRFREIAQLSAMLAEQAEGKAAGDELANVQVELLAAERARDGFKRERDERFGEIAAMTRLFKAAERGERHAEWMREITIVLLDTPVWWRLMPRKWVRRKELARLKGRGLFDGAAYLSNNPDVAAAQFDPLDHYIIHGFNEGRSFG